MFSKAFNAGIAETRDFWLTFSQTSPHQVFTWLQYKSFENTVGMGKLLVASNFPFSAVYWVFRKNSMGEEEKAPSEQFPLFAQCFLPLLRTFCHFCPIQNCHLQTLPVWKCLKFVVTG